MNQEKWPPGAANPATAQNQNTHAKYRLSPDQSQRAFDDERQRRAAATRYESYMRRNVERWESMARGEFYGRRRDTQQYTEADRQRDTHTALWVQWIVRQLGGTP